MKIDKSRTTIHNHYYGGDPAIIEKLNLIIEQNKKNMALTEQQFTEVLDVINQATNSGVEYAIAIQSKIDELKLDIANAGLAADAELRIMERLESIKTGAGNLATSLQAMAADETNPVPVPPPTEPTTPTEDI